MKTFKKSMLSVLLLLVFVFNMVLPAYAAEATVYFDDPTTTVGAEFEVKVRVTSASAVTSFNANFTYDANALRFVSGDYSSGANGNVELSWTGSSADASFTLRFQALSEGTTKIETASSNGGSADGSALVITDGWSDITIGPGDPSLIQPEQTEATPTGEAGSLEVTVGESKYTITNGFSEALVPRGFTKTTTTYEGNQVEVIKQDTSEEMAFYLTPSAGGEADFFMSNSDNGTFSPMEIVNITDERYIVLLRPDSGNELPTSYQETTFEINGKSFPAWVDMKNAPDYYAIYALNTDGQRDWYRYDSTDQTYQRLGNVRKMAVTEDETLPKGIYGKIVQFLQDHMQFALIGAWVIFLVLFIILIVVGVKLRHRNRELDDLYDEYGIDEEEEEEPQKKKNTKKQRYEEDEIEEYDADNFDEEEEFDDMLSFDEPFDEKDDEFGLTEELDFDDDDELDNLRSELDNELDDIDDVKTQLKKKDSSSRKSTFDTDFIDLD